MKQVMVLGLLTSILLGSSSCAEDPIDYDQLEHVKAALAPFQDLEYAMQQGYESDGKYVTDGGGGIGVHFQNSNILGIHEESPNILLYNLLEDGTYRLVAAEWIVPVTWVDEPPELFGRTFDGPGLYHHDVAEHYELHVWLFADNPDGLFALSNPTMQPPSYWPELQIARESTQDYIDVAAAEAAGFVSTEVCVTDGKGGGMGFHYVQDNLVYQDATLPNVLLYEPLANGGLRLVAAEWQVPSDIVSEAPQMFGQVFDGPHHADGTIADRYDMHVWLHKPNPRGLFSQFNPMVNCDALGK
jgi:hypothetical protein